MRRKLVLALTVLIFGFGVVACSSTGEDRPKYYHDAFHQVSCWMVGIDADGVGGGISCLPDNQVANPGQEG